VLLSDGTCPFDIGSNCIAYCEVYRTYFYDMERTLNGVSRNGPETGVEITQGKEYSISFSFNAGIGIADPGNVVSAGLGFGVTVTETSTTQITYQFQPTPPWCSYWAFIPIMFQTCGTLTTAELIRPPAPPGAPIPPPAYCSTTANTEADKCFVFSATPNILGNDAGIAVQVRVDCITGERAPMEVQDIAYRYPGVKDPCLDPPPAPQPPWCGTRPPARLMY